MNRSSYSSRAVLAAAAALSAPLLLSVAVLPGRVLLPAVSLAAIALAAVLALAAWARGARRRRPDATLWDACGILVFIGCGAAMLSQPESVLNLLGLEEAAR
jgi:hypothetical protein